MVDDSIDYEGVISGVDFPLSELKIVYDHAKAQLDRANGSKVSDPQGYSLTLARYKKVKKVYDKAIEKIIDKL